MQIIAIHVEEAISVMFLNGQRMKISYRNGNTTVFETQGLDGEISRTGDNRKFTYHFDNFGCPADVSDEDGAANSYQLDRRAHV